MSQALRPLFVTVTWGAGGSTAAKSLELAEICQRQLGLTTCMHLTCTNMSRSLVDEALNEAKALGVRNILALRGDPPRSGEYHMDDQEDSNKDFTWAIDLVRYIRKVHGDYFCIGVAGYPEGHADESHPEHQSVDRDLPYLVDKVKAGADFIMTQLTYDIEAYSMYEKTLRLHPSGAFKSIPIIPGLMPIQSYQIVKRITNLSHARLPAEISSRIEVVKSDDEAVKRVGVDILSELVEGIKGLPQPSSLPRGFHFYTLNLEKSVAFILERCNLIPSTESTSPSTTDSESESAAALAENGGTRMTNSVGEGPERRFSRRRASSFNSQPHNRLIVDSLRFNGKRSRSRQPHGALSSRSSETHQAPSESAGIPAGPLNPRNTLLISEGQGSLGREATWDDYPNGRWGPSSSPAFGEIDGYGPSLKVGPVAARRLWDHPKNQADITNLFKKHVEGDLVCLPWSDETDITSGGALRAETETIRKEIVALIEGKGYWTLASQPAINGISSDDQVFGWGPPGEGFVFQKPFVEFFVSRRSWDTQLKPLLLKHGEDEISWIKTDSEGHFESSAAPNTLGDHIISKPAAGETGVNAVTWGVFRGKEIVTPTIIEEQSFRAWAEEAYGIWEEWRRVFPRGSEEEKFLEWCKQDSVLVNVVGQQFVGRDGGKMWKILAEGQ